VVAFCFVGPFHIVDGSMIYREGDKVWFEIPSERFKPRTGSFAVITKAGMFYNREPLYAVTCNRVVCGKREYVVRQSAKLIYSGRPNERKVK